MFTNNYIKFRKMMFLNTSYASFKNINNANVNGYSVHGYGSDIGAYLNRARCKALAPTYTGRNPFQTENGGSGVFFGSDPTPATKDDYTLKNPITSGLVVTNPSALVWTDDGNCKHTVFADFILRNTTEAEINIYEIGIFTPVAASSSTSFLSDSVCNNILMERTVLDEPITIAPGESKLVTYKLTFNQTLNVE